jgi:long-chain acyl-CoA synthetase
LRQNAIVEHACVIGDRRQYLVALLTLDRDELAEWANAHGVRAGAGESLETHPSVRDYVEAHVERVNAEQAKYATIKRFDILSETFDVANGTLTPTMKLRRRQISDVYAEQIDGLYAP